MRVVSVLGAGMAGLGASYRLRQDGLPHVVFDMNDHFGGHTASHADRSGFTFDEGPHISFTKDPRIQQLFAENVNGEYEVPRARVNNWWRDRWIKHPAQCNLHGLPPKLVVQILLDMIEARDTQSTPANYAEWLIASYGKTFATLFPMEYGRKYHTTDAANMSLDWLGPRLYRPALDEVLLGALTAETPEVHYISEFRYPRRGGFVSFLTPLARGMDLRLQHRLVRLDPAQRTLTFANGVLIEYDHVISSIPLPELIRTIPSAPADVVAAADRLACSTCVVVNLGVNRPDLSDWHWTYFYDDAFCFSRISFPHLFSAHNAPAGMSSVQAEIYFSPKYKPLNSSADAYIPIVIADLKRCGLLGEHDQIVHQGAQLVPYANIIFDLDRAEALSLVRGYLDDIGVQCCGRYGEWGYYWTDQSFISGENAAQRVLDAMTTPVAIPGSVGPS